MILEENYEEREDAEDDKRRDEGGTGRGIKNEEKDNHDVKK